VEAGVISDADVGMLHFTDDVDDAFAYITRKLVEWEAVSAAAKATAAEAAKTAAISAAAAAYSKAIAAAHEATHVGVPSSAHVPPPPLALGVTHTGAVGGAGDSGATAAAVPAGAPGMPPRHPVAAHGGSSGGASVGGGGSISGGMAVFGARPGTDLGASSPLMTPATVQFALAHVPHPQGAGGSVGSATPFSTNSDSDAGGVGGVVIPAGVGPNDGFALGDATGVMGSPDTPASPPPAAPTAAGGAGGGGGGGSAALGLPAKIKSPAMHREMSHE